MKKTRNVLALIVVLILCCATVLAACSQDKVTISRSTASVAVGDTVTLTAEASNGGAISWSSSNVAVATVNNGVVTGVSVGTAKITAASGTARAECTVTVTNEAVDEDSYISVAEYRAYSKNDLDYLRTRISRGGVNTTVLANVDTALNAGKAAIDAAKTVSAVKSAVVAAKAAMAECIPLANGTIDYSGFTYEQCTELLGILEEFAIANGMTGTTLYASAGFVMYSDRISLGSENYILGYGFGTLAEGEIDSTKPLAYETNNAWKLYYHTATATDPGHINTQDDKGSETSDFASYTTTGGFTAFMNAEKNGYEWVPELAVSMPTPVGELDENGMATKWRVELRSNLKYSTNSASDRMGSYNNRDVALEDFLTPYKLLLNSKNGWQRGSEFANRTDASGIKGAKEYYEATKAAESNANGISAASFEGVGLKVVEEGGKWYMEYELLQPVTPFFAMRYCPAGDPVPEAFIGAIGGADNYQKFGKSGTSADGWSPVDTSLSVGPYVLESWTSGQEIVYKKNPNYVYASTKYKPAGIHFKVLPAAKDNPEAIFNEFLANHLDASSIPSTKLSEYKNDPRTKHSLGTSCFKLNMNALNSADWDKFFGENGSVKMTSADSKWIVEPAMSNAHFRQGLSFALNRNEIGDVFGSVGSVDYFAPHFLADPELGTAYNATDAHKHAVEQLYGTVGGQAQTDNAGYSLELARDYFRMAISELEASGAYTPGTKANPTVIKLEIAWQYPVNRTEEHQYVKQYWETAFNDDSVTGGLYKLEIDFYVGATWQDAYFSKMLIGQFDMGFGSISSDSQNPLGGMNVLSTNQTISQGFTLNWAIDTNDPTADVLVFEGKRWSYDALFSCTEQATVVTNGKIEDKLADIDQGFSVSKLEDGSVKLTISLRANNGTEIGGHLFAIYSGETAINYVEYDLDNTEGIVASQPIVNGNRTTYVYTISKDIINSLPMAENQGVDIYAWGTKDGQPVGSQDTPLNAGNGAHNFKDMVIYSGAAGFKTEQSTRPNGIVFEVGDYGVSMIITTLDGVENVTIKAKLLIGDEEIAVDKVLPEATEVAAIGGICFDFKLTPEEIAALVAGKEYNVVQGLVVYADYTINGVAKTDILVDIYSGEWIEAPETPAE